MSTFQSKQISQPLSLSGSFTGSLLGTASTASFVTLTGLGITVNGTQLTASVRSVNGILPTNGNIATTLTAVTTGTSASLQVSSSGAVTASLTNGLVWIIANNTPDPTKNGNAYIFVSGAIGQWYQLSGYDTSVYDARYLQLAGGTMAGNITMNSGFSLLGTASWASNATNAINSQTASFLPVGTYQITSSWAVSASQAISSSFATTASFALNVNTAPTYLIATGSVTASVDVGTDTFLVKSGVTTLANIKSNGNILIGGSTDSGFKLDINGTTRSQGKLTVSTGGATIIGSTDITGSFSVDNTSGSLTLSSGSGRTLTLNAPSSSVVFNYQGNYTIQLGYDGTGKGIYAQSFTGGPAGDYVNFTGKQGNFDTIQAGQGLVANQYTALNLVGRAYSGIGPNVASINLKNSFSTNTTRMIIYDNASTGSPVSILPTDGNLLVGTTTDSGYKLLITGSGVSGSGVSGSLNVNNVLIVSGSQVTVTGSLSLTDVLVLPFSSPLPSSKPTGSIALSGSGGTFNGMYVYNGTSWVNVKA